MINPLKNPQIGFKVDMSFEKCIAHSALELSLGNVGRALRMLLTGRLHSLAELPKKNHLSYGFEQQNCHLKQTIIRNSIIPIDYGLNHLLFYGRSPSRHEQSIFI